MWNKGDLDLVDELCAPDLVIHNLPDGVPPGSEGLKAIIAFYRAAFPDIKITIDFTIAEGDMVVNRWTSTGTHTGDLMGIAPTGRLVDSSGMVAVRIEGGLIVEFWTESDQLVVMQQLGVVPPPGG